MGRSVGINYWAKGSILQAPVDVLSDPDSTFWRMLSWLDKSKETVRCQIDAKTELTQDRKSTLILQKKQKAKKKKAQKKTKTNQQEPNTNNVCNQCWTSKQVCKWCAPQWWTECNQCCMREPVWNYTTECWHEKDKCLPKQMIEFWREPKMVRVAKQNKNSTFDVYSPKLDGATQGSRSA